MSFGRLASLCTEFLPSPPESPSMFRSYSRCENITLNHAAFTFSPEHPLEQRTAVTNQSGRLPSRPQEAYRASSQVTRGQRGPQNLDFRDPQTAVTSSIFAATRYQPPSELLSPESTSGGLGCDQGSTDSRDLGKLDLGAQLTSRHECSRDDRQSDEEQEVHSSTSDGDEDHTGEEMTAAERLAEKRKMKRFRYV